MRRAARSTWTSATSGAPAPRRVDSSALRDRDDQRRLAGRSLSSQRRALGDDPAVVDDHDVVGELVGLLEVLGREQQGRAVAHEVAQHVPELDPAARVQPGGRLVEEEHRRRGDQADREVEPAPHAAGVGLDHLVCRPRSARTARAARRSTPLHGPRGRGRRAGRSAGGSRGRSAARRPSRTGRSGPCGGARPPAR